MNKLHRVAALIAAATLTLTACSDDTGASDGGGDVPESAGFNDADVSFATEMIPHHAQALMMVDMAAGRDVSPQFGALLEQIRAAQAPEIELMTDWLEDWDQPVPDNPRDHGGMDHGDGDMGDMGDMPGMMDAEELDDLGAVRGPGFEDRWLEMMIAHHEGAIRMAEEEIESGEYADAISLAKDIVDSQSAEIEQMESML